MALTRNGAAVANAKRNGYALSKVTVNGTTVWTLSSPSSTGWVSKTGAFIKMTSNSAPSPFTASIENSYGSYWVSSTNYWYAFDNSTGNTLNLECQKLDGEGNAYVGVKCSFGKTIRVKTMTFDGLSGWGTRGIRLVKSGTAVYEVGDSNIKDSSTFTVPTVECDSVVIFVRQTVSGNGSSITCGKFQITSWEEKETWVLKSGTHTTQTLNFALGGSETVTGSTFTAVKPTQLYLNYELVCREWVVDHNVRVDGLTESGSWVTLVSHTKRLDGDSSNASDYTMSHNGNVAVSVTQPIKQLRVYIDGRYWANTITVKIVEWYQKG